MARDLSAASATNTRHLVLGEHNARRPAGGTSYLSDMSILRDCSAVVIETRTRTSASCVCWNVFRPILAPHNHVLTGRTWEQIREDL